MYLLRLIWSKNWSLSTQLSFWRGRCLIRCLCSHLQNKSGRRSRTRTKASKNYTSELPDFSVVSNVFKKKQDSEQSTAELALEKDDDDDITVEQAWDDIVQRVKFLSADHPLGSHLRATLQRDGERHGSVHVMSSLHLIQRSTIAIKLSILKQ
ncbi:hypothetical protein F2Q69_00033795 [Brassica cretica]|uniref:Uncharacterized protein n=1 Tax=Brassica cretica TaxID=69181 RepID=A0A8S9SHI3_BRACR|nr:hypothetical protein F2Q69_00033795 [Brassica cretica]